MYTGQLKDTSHPTYSYIIHMHHSLHIVNGMHMAWIFWFADYSALINIPVIVKPHALIFVSEAVATIL